MAPSTSTIILALCHLSATNAFLIHYSSSFDHSLEALDQNFSYLSGLGVGDSSEQVSSATTSSPFPTESPIQEQGVSPLAQYNGPVETHDIIDRLTPVQIQGGSLKTCSFNEDVERVAVYLKTEGRPLSANVELWQGPDNSPQRMSVYLEDGNERPFRCVVESPGSSNAVSIRNTAEMEFPLVAGLDVDLERDGISPARTLHQDIEGRVVQGGAVYTMPFAPAVKSVQVALQTDGRPLNARIELLQGPNNNKQVMEVYTEDGYARPFFAIIETPGTGNVVRIVNSATIEFPLTAALEPYVIDENIYVESSEPGGMIWS